MSIDNGNDSGGDNNTGKNKDSNFTLLLLDYSKSEQFQFDPFHVY